MKSKTIDFHYSFHAPHTLTLSRPSASEKFVVDVSESGLKFWYATHSLRDIHPLSWTILKQDVQIVMSVSVGGKSSVLDKWYRHRSGAPYLFAEGKDGDVSYFISAVACKHGAVVKTEAVNNGSSAEEVFFQTAHTSGWVISNKGWIDGVHNHVLMTMNDGRADKLLVCAYGADSYPMYKNNMTDEDKPPMANETLGIKPNSMKKITSRYALLPGEKKTGYLFMPYEMFWDDLNEIDRIDFEKEMADALTEWETLLGEGADIRIANDDLLHCYRACIADLFVMRERIGDHMGISCGTRFYRSANSGESLESTILLETLGYKQVVHEDYPTYLNGQDKDGCWVTSTGWEHEVWALIFNKTNAVMEHYYMTRDRDFLEKMYPKMYASAMFDYRARNSTKSSKIPSERGLMPRGMGDCGMMNNGDYYGVFYPHNCLSVAADGQVLEAAKILGKTEDVALLTNVYEEAKEALLTSIRENLAEIDGYRVIPPVAHAPITSMYGCLYSVFPGNLISGEDPIVQDTIRYLENNKVSEGGLPVGMGWMKDGLWVAMALSNVARAYLRMGMYEEARKYLYPALNHASPFVTWCEERGAEKDSAKISGDKQHLWTPLSVGQYLTEALFFENENAVHICAGACPEWLSEGKEISVKGFYSHYGKTDFAVRNIGGEYTFDIKTERKIEKEIHLHLPGEIRKIKAI